MAIALINHNFKPEQTLNKGVKKNDQIVDNRNEPKSPKPSFLPGCELVISAVNVGI